MKMKFITVCFFSVLVAGSTYAGKNDANLATLKTAFETLADASGKNMKLTFTDKEYTFIYYASNASEECRKFTPELIKFYVENKKSASIEIIFVSLDKTEKEMTEQIKAMSIPFPIVDYKEIAKSGITKFAGQELPSLLLLDKEGNIVADCYEGKRYMGPGKVLEKFKEIMSTVGYD
jgi:hypothetical protein